MDSHKEFFMSIVTRMAQGDHQLEIESRGPDAVGIIAGLTQQVEAESCWFLKLTFHIYGVNEGRCGINAIITGPPHNLRILQQALQGKEVTDFIDRSLQGEAAPDVSAEYSQLWHLAVYSPDRPGILRVVSNSVSGMFGNFLWLHADTTNDEAPMFKIVAIVAFNKIILAGALVDNVRTGFNLRDEDERKAPQTRDHIEKRPRSIIKFADGNVIAHRLGM